MGYRSKIAAVVLLAGVAAACGSDRHSSAAFRLPRDGNVERGQAAFLALGCNNCHEVSGVDLPRPTVRPAVPVVLGGAVDAKLSDAYLATSIIYRLMSSLLTRKTKL